ncbi:MAG: hypothetical protein AAFO94_20820, partial [Bacteroidota bacterium]
KDQLNIEMGFSGYHTSRTDHFPFLAFSMENVFVNGNLYDQDKKRLLEIERLNFQLHPWDLLFQKYNIANIELEGAAFYFHKDSTGSTNTKLITQILSGMRDKKVPTAEASGQINLNQYFRNNIIEFRDLSIDYTDDLMHKMYQLTLREGTLSGNPQGQQLLLDLQSNCFFDGLVFKPENGAFLQKQIAQLKLKTTLTPDTIFFEPSTLRFRNELLHLQGSLSKDSPNHLKLNIRTDSILLDDARPLMDRKIQAVLERFELDQPVRAEFKLDGLLRPFYPPKIELHFQGDSSHIALTDISSMEQASFKASFYNDYKTKGPQIKPSDGALVIHSLTGRFMGMHPVDVKGKIHDLRGLRDVEFEGELNAWLPALQEYMASPAVRFEKGMASVRL